MKKKQLLIYSEIVILIQLYAMTNILNYFNIYGIIYYYYIFNR